METKDLEAIGLSKQQSEVYLKLLELGPTSVGKSVKHLDISRISCYDTLNRLISRGLVSFVKARGNRIYQATDPKKLLQFAEEQEKQASERKFFIKNLIPKLEKIRLLGEKEDKEATIYKTKEGVKSLFELMLKIKRPIYVISATGKALDEMKFYFPQWHMKRKKLKIPIKVIFNLEIRNKMAAEMPLADIKFLPKEYSSPSTLFVFGDYVATLLWSEIPFAFVIKSEEIAKSYNNYFNLIWKTANF